MNVCCCIIYEDFRIKFHHLPLVNCFASSIIKIVTLMFIGPCIIVIVEE